jgi:pimeloyl-ACP methyl ester carboxylesterase
MIIRKGIFAAAFVGMPGLAGNTSHAAGQVPFLIVQGTNDQAAPPQNGQMLKADLGDRATLANIPSAGHLMVVTKPDVVSEEIVKFIRQHANAGK